MGFGVFLSAFGKLVEFCLVFHFFNFSLFIPLAIYGLDMGEDSFVFLLVWLMYYARVVYSTVQYDLIIHNPCTICLFSFSIILH